MDLRTKKNNMFTASYTFAHERTMLQCAKMSCVVTIRSIKRPLCNEFKKVKINVTQKLSTAT